jgi:hypothetical protein
MWLVCALSIWLLFVLGRVQGPYKFFWLLPYPPWSPRIMAQLVSAAFTMRPLEATALLIVAPLTLLLSGLWLAVRLSSRLRPQGPTL